MKSRRTLVLSALLFGLACDDSRHPTGTLRPPTDASEIIQDGAHNGNPDFFFLPPMVPLPYGNPAFELGEFNNRLQPALSVEICELSDQDLHPTTGRPKGDTPCVDPNNPLKRFEPGDVQLVNLPRRQWGWWSLFKLPDDGFYYVLWNTKQSQLDVTKYYRIKVLLEGLPDPLGVADVDPMRNLFQWKHSLTGEVIQLIDDMILPIPFRVEKGALCPGTDPCTSATFTKDATTTQELTLEGEGGGTIAGVSVPPGSLGDNAPENLTFTIRRVKLGQLGSGGLVSAASAQNAPPTLCHPDLRLQQFGGCFSITTTPELEPLEEGSADTFLNAITVAACFELKGQEDPREDFVQLYSSDVDETPRALESVATDLVSADEADCSSIDVEGASSNAFIRFGQKGWRNLQAGLGSVFGVKTVYAGDKGLGGLTKLLSNIGWALTAEMQIASANEQSVDPGETATFTVRVVGVPHHDQEGEPASVGIAGVPVTFTLAADEGCVASLIGSATGSITPSTNATGNASVSVAVTSGTCTVTAASTHAAGGPVTFSATLSAPVIPNPVLAFTGSELYSTGGTNYVRYDLSVTNFESYPAEMFAAAPTLPPCGFNDNSSRTWVDIYNASTDARIYGFCGLGSPSGLQSIWFGEVAGTTPPSQVYVVLIDRLTGLTYRSNNVTPVGPDVIAFETYPDGSVACDGAASCAVTTQFMSLGVEFIFSQVPGGGGGTPFLCRTPWGPDGEGPNYGVSPAVLSGCSSWHNGHVTMTFAGHPTTVEFQLEGNASTGSVFPVNAWGPDYAAVTVTQVSAFTYSPSPGLTFRREIRRVTGSAGVLGIQIPSDDGVRIIDNLRIVP